MKVNLISLLDRTERHQLLTNEIPSYMTTLGDDRWAMVPSHSRSATRHHNFPSWLLVWSYFGYRPDILTTARLTKDSRNSVLCWVSCLIRSSFVCPSCGDREGGWVIDVLISLAGKRLVSGVREGGKLIMSLGKRKGNAGRGGGGRKWGL